MDNLISTFSSMLGYTMVAASFVMILPQIYNILIERRVDGMNLTSLTFDLIAAVMGFTMNWTLSNPFRQDLTFTFILSSELMTDFLGISGSRMVDQNSF